MYIEVCFMLIAGSLIWCLNKQPDMAVARYLCLLLSLLWSNFDCSFVLTIFKPPLPQDDARFHKMWKIDQKINKLKAQCCHLNNIFKLNKQECMPSSYIKYSANTLLVQWKNPLNHTVQIQYFLLMVLDCGLV